MLLSGMWWERKLQKLSCWSIYTYPWLGNPQAVSWHPWARGNFPDCYFPRIFSCSRFNFISLPSFTKVPQVLSGIPQIHSNLIPDPRTDMQPPMQRVEEMRKDISEIRCLALGMSQIKISALISLLGIYPGKMKTLIWKETCAQCSLKHYLQ